MLKQVESLLSSPESPDDILRSLENEMRKSRARRESSKGQRTAVLAGGLFLVIGGTAVALVALFSSLRDLPRMNKIAGSQSAGAPQR